MAKEVFELLPLTELPSMAAPWSSADAGETWVWGDFFMTFQKRPITMMESMAKIAKHSIPDTGLTYHYAMTVFYRMDRNPHGQSRRPVASATLEQSDMSITARRLGLNAPSGGMSPLFLGMFAKGGARISYGEYDGPLTPQAVKNELFKMIGEQLGLVGQPRCIGTIAQAYGNAETGLPPQERGGNNSGCAVLLFLGTGLAALAAWGISFI